MVEVLQRHVAQLIYDLIYGLIEGKNLLIKVGTFKVS